MDGCFAKVQKGFIRQTTGPKFTDILRISPPEQEPVQLLNRAGKPFGVKVILNRTKRLLPMKNLVLFFSLFLVTLLPAQVLVSHVTEANTGEGEPVTGFLLADSVVLRSGPGTDTKNLGLLRTGTEIELLDFSQEKMPLRGIESYWYHIRCNKQEGWIWGGFIATGYFRSNEDPSVAFLIGFSHQQLKKDSDGITEYTYNETYVQIRAVRGNQLLDKLVLHEEVTYPEVQQSGRMGVEGVDDILMLLRPCLGGCGCSGGTDYIFWDGAKLHFVYNENFIADAASSEWDALLLPSSKGGEQGYIKIAGNHVDTSFYAQDGRDIMQRVQTVSWYTWNGEKLVKAAGKKTQRKIIYIDHETDKVIDKPED